MALSPQRPAAWPRGTCLRPLRSRHPWKQRRRTATAARRTKAAARRAAAAAAQWGLAARQAAAAAAQQTVTALSPQRPAAAARPGGTCPRGRRAKEPRPPVVPGAAWQLARASRQAVAAAAAARRAAGALSPQRPAVAELLRPGGPWKRRSSVPKMAHLRSCPACRCGASVWAPRPSPADRLPRRCPRRSPRAPRRRPARGRSCRAAGASLGKREVTKLV